MRGARYAALALEEGRAELVVLRSTSNGVAMEDRRIAPLTGFGEAEIAAAIRQLRPPNGISLTLGLPISEALVHIGVFPAKEHREWRGMAELTAEDISPFPLEEMYVSAERIHEDAAGVRAATVLIRRAALDAAAGAARAAGLWPVRADLNLFGWWHQWRTLSADASLGRHHVLRLNGSGVEWLVFDHHIPIHAAGWRAGGPDELAQTWRDGMLPLAWEHGVLDVIRTEVWIRPEESDRWPVESLSAALREAVGSGEVRIHVDDGPSAAEGLARRTASTDPGLMDAAPAEWKKSQARAVHRRYFLRVGVCAVAAWLTMMGGFSAALAAHRAAATRAEQAAERLRAEAESVREIRDHIRSLENHLARDRSALETLREIVTHLPTGVELSSFTYRKNGPVGLRGLSDVPESAFDYLQALERSPFFVRKEVGQVNTRTIAGARKTDFNITLHLPAGPEASP